MASERWRNDVAYAMTPFRLLMWPLGVWPLQVYNVYSLIRCVLATCCMSAIMILPAIELRMGCTDAEQNIHSFMLICCGVLAVVKMIWFRVYAANLADNYGSAVDDYRTAEKAEQRVVMRRHASIGRTLCYSMVFVAYFDCCIYAMMPLLDDEQAGLVNESAVLKYTIPSRCALEYLGVTESTAGIFSFIELVVLMLASTSNYGNDALFLNITLHVCGQVKLLNDDFVNFDITIPQVYDRFNALIRRHGHLIRLARKLAEAVRFILLMQLFVSSVLLCVIGFQSIFALKIKDYVMMMKSFMVLATFLAQLSIYSFVGDYLIFQMEEIGLSIFRSAWYDLPADMTRNLSFIIMRAQSPVKLQAGSFMVVNLSSYMSILKTSISYLSVLRVMVEV